MDERLSKAEILKRLETEYLRLQTALDGVTQAQMISPGVCGTWSIKDILAHLIYWNDLPVNELEHALAGESLPNEDLDDETINARSVAEYHTKSTDEVMIDFDASFLRVVDAVHALPASAFESDNELEQRLGNTVHGTLSGNTYDHYAEHLEEILTWLKKSTAKTKSVITQRKD